MPTLADVREIALALPEMEEPAEHQWRVRNKLVTWKRPLKKADLEALGDGAPSGTIIGVRVGDVGEQRILVDTQDGAFITPHFNNWPGVLIELESIDRDVLAELIAEAWLIQAPKGLSRPWLEARGRT